MDEYVRRIGGAAVELAREMRRMGGREEGGGGVVCFWDGGR